MAIMCNCVEISSLGNVEQNVVQNVPSLTRFLPIYIHFKSANEITFTKNNFFTCVGDSSPPSPVLPLERIFFSSSNAECRFFFSSSNDDTNVARCLPGRSSCRGKFSAHFPKSLCLGPYHMLMVILVLVNGLEN